MRLYIALLKANIKREWAYKENFITFCLVTFIGYLGNTLFYILLYQFTDDINGWSKYHMLVLVATVWIINSLNGGVFHMNMLRLPRYVQNYDLDYILIKPVCTRWFVSMKFISYGLLSGVPCGVVLLLYSLIKLGIYQNIVNILLYLIGILFGTLIIHNIFFILMLLSVKFIKIDALMSVFWNILDGGTYPQSMYPKKMKLVFTFIIPVLVVYNFPVTFLIESIEGFRIIMIIFVGGGLTLLSNLIWNYIIQFYYQ